MTPLERPVDPALMNEAQKVHTEVYLREGFIGADDLDENGLFIDEYTDRSEPVVVQLGSKETTIRMIHATKKEGLLSLPTPKHFEVDPDEVRRIAKVSRLSDIKPRQAVEISGLASIALSETTSTTDVFDATRQVYATGLRRSLDQGHSLWTMNVDTRLQKSLALILGKEAITQIGEEQSYMGPATIPVALNPQAVVESILTQKGGRYADMNRADIAHTLGGVSERHLPSHLIKLLHDNDIETKKGNLLARAVKHKKALGYTGIILYSTGRAIPVAMIPEFEGNPFVFAGIDVGTALTQVLGMEKYLTGKRVATRMGGAALAVGSLIAPYGYVWLTGEDYPPYVNAIAGTLIGGAVVGEIAKSKKDRKIRNGLLSTDISAV